MGSLLTLALVLVVLVKALPAARKQWQEDRAGAIRTAKIAGLFIVYWAAGLFLGTSLIPAHGGPESTIIALLLIFVFGWVLYGALWLLRLVPRYRELPEWLLRPGVADAVIVAPVAVSVVALLAI